MIKKCGKETKRRKEMRAKRTKNVCKPLVYNILARERERRERKGKKKVSESRWQPLVASFYLPHQCGRQHETGRCVISAHVQLLRAIHTHTHTHIHTYIIERKMCKCANKSHFIYSLVYTRFITRRGLCMFFFFF